MPADHAPVATGHGPARGYKWPPFEAGNTASLQHGAHSPRVVQPVADALAAQVTTVAPWVAAEPFAATVAAWSWAEAQTAILRAHIDAVGILDDEGEPRGAVSWLDRCERRAERLRAELGLTPMALAKLLAALGSIDAGKVPEGLDALRQAGAQVRRDAEARTLGAGVDHGGHGTADQEGDPE